MADGTTGWQMEFWKGGSFSDFNRFLVGPEKMKDIRMKRLPDGRVAIMSRPQGGAADMGKIGFAIARNWNAVTPRLMADAPVYEHLFRNEEWGGANELHLLGNGQLGVWGHIAYLTSGDVRHADGTATRYAGLSDAEAGWLNMKDPFVAFETNGSAS